MNIRAQPSKPNQRVQRLQTGDMTTDYGRKSYWMLTCWGEPAGRGEGGFGLYRSQEAAEKYARHLIDEVKWPEKEVVIEELRLTQAEVREHFLLTREKIIEWDNAIFTGPRGGQYRLSGTGQSRIYLR